MNTMLQLHDFWQPTRWHDYPIPPADPAPPALHPHWHPLPVQVLAERRPDLCRDVVLLAPAGLAPIMPDNTFSWGIYFRWLSPQRIARTLGRVGLAGLKGLLRAAGVRVTNPTFPPL